MDAGIIIPIPASFFTAHTAYSFCSSFLILIIPFNYTTAHHHIQILANFLTIGNHYCFYL